MAVLAGAYEAVTAATAAGDVDSARAWLLVREFRKPTRFSRPGADATLALGALARGHHDARGRRWRRYVPTCSTPTRLA